MWMGGCLVGVVIRVGGCNRFWETNYLTYLHMPIHVYGLTYHMFMIFL